MPDHDFLKIPDRQSLNDIDGCSAHHALMDDYMKYSKPAKPGEGDTPDSHVEKRTGNLAPTDFKFSGQLFLIGGVAKTTWYDMIARQPKDAKVVAVGLAADDGDGASLALAKDFEDSGIKPENITVISNSVKPNDTKYNWSKELPDKFDLVYFGGGDQTVLKERFTQVDKLRKALQDGAMIAGNSAGTAIMSSEMITGGDAKSLTHGEGFSVLPWATTDTHVHQRHRESRDISALYAIDNGNKPVIGMDADTRVLFHFDGEHLIGEVSGFGSVHVFQRPGKELKTESTHEILPQLTYGSDGDGKGRMAEVWELKQGDKFILK